MLFLCARPNRFLVGWDCSAPHFKEWVWMFFCFVFQVKPQLVAVGFSPAFIPPQNTFIVVNSAKVEFLNILALAINIHTIRIKSIMWHSWTHRVINYRRLSVQNRNKVGTSVNVHEASFLFFILVSRDELTPQTLHGLQMVPKSKCNVSERLRKKKDQSKVIKNRSLWNNLKNQFMPS